MIITLSGNPGSGKSTVAKILIKKLDFERVYAGGIIRDMSKEQGITFEEFLYKLKSDQNLEKQIDHRVGEEAKKIAEQGKDVIVEGRVQFHLIPESIKIYVKVGPEEGARRIFKDLNDEETAQQRNQEMVANLQEMINNNEVRETKDAERYLKLYGVDHRKEEQYDLIVDTTFTSAEESAQKVIDYLKSLKKEE
ncbi:AAA family ATPase [archaeon]|jgi:CMP/dCMP kinase|nr:AAA family ATPase [archaeon]MBT3451541.1 AAA family ATPase [archaeon]MBT6869400.1 AAA family ATPase [archaeon]MBT7192563.1 AAA family ATPase [archaeon]MBT7380639.1 AAA family ATPase [archaeon]